jgi:hypothetical protein
MMTEEGQKKNGRLRENDGRARLLLLLLLRRQPVAAVKREHHGELVSSKQRSTYSNVRVCDFAVCSALLIVDVVKRRILLGHVRLRPPGRPAARTGTARQAATPTARGARNGNWNTKNN